MSTTPCKNCIDFHAKNISRMFENLPALPCKCESCDCYTINKSKKLITA